MIARLEIIDHKTTILSRTQPMTNAGEEVGKRNPHTLLVGM
jgi:hypothetical protein